MVTVVNVNMFTLLLVTFSVFQAQTKLRLKLGTFGVFRAQTKLRLKLLLSEESFIMMK